MFPIIKKLFSTEENERAAYNSLTRTMTLHPTMCILTLKVLRHIVAPSNHLNAELTGLGYLGAVIIPPIIDEVIFRGIVYKLVKYKYTFFPEIFANMVYAYAYMGKYNVPYKGSGWFVLAEAFLTGLTCTFALSYYPLQTVIYSRWLANIFTSW